MLELGFQGWGKSLSAHPREEVWLRAFREGKPWTKAGEPRTLHLTWQKQFCKAGKEWGRAMEEKAKTILRSNNNIHILQAVRRLWSTICSAISSLIPYHFQVYCLPVSSFRRASTWVSLLVGCPRVCFAKTYGAPEMSRNLYSPMILGSGK